MRHAHERHKSNAAFSAANSMQKARRSQQSRLALRVSCRHRRNPQLPARARAAVTVTKQYNIVFANIMLTSIVSTPPCCAILYCAMTSISKVSSRSRVILSVVPMCLARLLCNFLHTSSPESIGPSECGRDRPGFGCDAVYKKLRRIQYYRVLNIINSKLYNVL